MKQNLKNEASSAVLENFEKSDKKELINPSQADNLNDNNLNLNTQASSSMNTQNTNQNFLPLRSLFSRANLSRDKKGVIKVRFL